MVNQAGVVLKKADGTMVLPTLLQDTVRLQGAYD